MSRRTEPDQYPADERKPLRGKRYKLPKGLDVQVRKPGGTWKEHTMQEAVELDEVLGPLPIAGKVKFLHQGWWIMVEREILKLLQ